MAGRATNFYPKPNPLKYHQLLLHGIVFLWGLTSILGKAISLEKPLLVAWRTGLAAIGLFLILRFRKIPLPPASAILKMLGVGLIIGVHWLFFFLPGKLSTISAGLVGLSSITLWCALLDPLVNKEKKLGVLELALAVATIIGASIIGLNDPSTLTGLSLGVAAALTAAAFTFCNAGLIKTHDSFTITFFEMIGASCLMSIAAWFTLPTGTNWMPQGAKDWILLLLLSQICTVVAFSACTWLQKRVPVYQIALASNLEPLYGGLLAAAIYREHEQLQPSFFLGSGIILACVLGYLPLSQRRA